MPVFKRVAVKRIVRLLGVMGVLAMVCAGSAFASGPGVGWQLSGAALSTNLPPGGEGYIRVDVFNIGAAASGTATLTDVLPAGVTATGATSGAQLSCQPAPPAGATVVTCEVGSVGPSSFAFIQLPVKVAADAGGALGAVNRMTISGGGAVASASGSFPVSFGDEFAPAGIESFNAWVSNADGSMDTQAGSHPYELGVAFDLNVNEPHEAAFSARPSGGSNVYGEPSAVNIDLPPGLAGDARAIPQCEIAELEREECPPSAQIGVDYAYIAAAGGFGFNVFNMAPPPGTPVEFGFSFNGLTVLLVGGLRSGGDNGEMVHIDPFPQQEQVTGNVAYIWGVPGEHGTGAASAPLLTLPTSCGAPESFGMEELGTWQEPNLPRIAVETPVHDSEGQPAGFTGCEKLGGVPFEPTVALAPDISSASTPAGLGVDIRFPPDELEGLTAPRMQAATVTLPEGLAVNPGRATGLEVCQPSQEALGQATNGETNEGPISCPSASRVGTIKVKSPILEGALEKELVGGIYVMRSSPPNLELLLAPSGDGINIKQPMKIHLDEATGQLTSTFAKIPDQPISEEQLTFEGGPRGSLVTPSSCGTFTTTTDLTPWSSPFTPDAFPTASFDISSGVAGLACNTPLGFSPAFTAGSTADQAGGFSPVTVSISRQDTEQDMGDIQVTTPPGLLAVLKGVERCSEPQAAQGACGAGSLIGHATVTAGPGPDPVVVQGGQVFLTGPYKGAPFGLSIVVPAVAGPFNLGNVVVRARVMVDPHTAQITIVSDPLPTILDGVPLHLKTANVVIDRSGFTFNPTNCSPSSVNGVLTSTQGATASVSSPFQAAYCANLAFKPSFKVFTQAKTGKKQGASLDVKVGSGAGQANLAGVAVSLPKQLPSRLTTIQQACTEAVFTANPSSCPTGSDIGTATATTPVLAGPAVGPVYLVSHGGAAFPDIVMVLQDEGVTLEIVGNIDIKKGVTSSAFDAVPDVPITSFELSLPEGSHSALATNIPAKAKGSLCGQSLVMPTTLTGQNNARVTQSTKVTVTGCPKAKAKAKKKTHKPKPKKKAHKAKSVKRRRG